MKIKRHKTRIVKIGGIKIGGRNPVAVQSMTKVRNSDVERAVKQIRELESCGCEIVRLAVKDKSDAMAIKDIKKRVKMPLVADIHFNWKLAIMAIEAGADKIRLNPGNIYRKEEVRNVVSALKSAGIPLRIGVNSGSVKSASARQTMADRLVKSALDYIKLIEGFRFRDIVLSLKASTVLDTVEAYRKISRLCDYPLHLGVTATGLPFAGAIKSSIAIGALLQEGIGDTIRISLTDEPKEEVKAAKVILESLGLRNFGPEIISCPTCGRCEVNLTGMVRELEGRLASVNCGGNSGRPVKLAVMGCVVNGPGEAKEADIGIAFGSKDGLLFKSGKALRKVSVKSCINELLKEGEKIWQGH